MAVSACRSAIFARQLLWHYRAPTGQGKSTFLRILTGELDSTTGSIEIDPTKRVSVLKQNQNAYDDYTVMDTVIMGNKHLYDVMKEKDSHL